jgi:hypothetical protein
MSIKFEYITDMDVSAYWTDHESPITFVLDNLMNRKNESVQTIAKRISQVYLQELICQEHDKCVGFNEQHCKVSWCPMRIIARKMML